MKFASKNIVFFHRVYQVRYEYIKVIFFYLKNKNLKLSWANDNYLLKVKYFAKVKIRQKSEDQIRIRIAKNCKISGRYYENAIILVKYVGGLQRTAYYLCFFYVVQVFVAVLVILALVVRGEAEAEANPEAKADPEADPSYGHGGWARSAYLRWAKGMQIFCSHLG